MHMCLSVNGRKPHPISEHQPRFGDLQAEVIPFSLIQLITVELHKYDPLKNQVKVTSVLVNHKTAFKF